MKRVLAIASLLAIGPTAYAQACPPLPHDRPANSSEVACRASQCGSNPASCRRCSGLTRADDCAALIDFAFDASLIDAGARDWLRVNGFCPVASIWPYRQILELCPFN